MDKFTTIFLIITCNLLLIDSSYSFGWYIASYTVKRVSLLRMVVKSFINLMYIILCIFLLISLVTCECRKIMLNLNLVLMNDPPVLMKHILCDRDDSDDNFEDNELLIHNLPLTQ